MRVSPCPRRPSRKATGVLSPSITVSFLTEETTALERLREKLTDYQGAELGLAFWSPSASRAMLACSKPFLPRSEC